MKKSILFVGIVAVFILISCNKKIYAYRIANLTEETITIEFIGKDEIAGFTLKPQRNIISSGVNTKDLNFSNTDVFTILYKDTVYVDSKPYVGGVLDKQAYKLNTQPDGRDWYQFDITEEYILSLPKADK